MMVSSVVEQMQRAVLAARAVPAIDTALTDDELREVTALTAELTRIADGRTVEIAAQTVARSAGSGARSFCRRSGHRSPSALLVSQFGVQRGEAMRILAVAVAVSPQLLDDDSQRTPLPELAAALRAGDVSLGQAAAIVTGLGTSAHLADPQLVAESDAGLVALATGTPNADAWSPEHLTTIARAVAGQLDPDRLVDDHARMVRERRATITRLDDGMWRLTALLPPDSAAVIQHMLDALASPRRQVRFDDDLDHDLADEACPDEHDPRTIAQRKADAVVDVFSIYAASGNAPTVGGEAPTVIVTVAADALERADALEPATSIRDILAGALPTNLARLEHTGDVIPAAVAATLLCDANIRIAGISDTGEVLRFGRRQRLFQPGQRLVLIMRDQTCQGPGCDMPAEWCEAHHILSWLRGGLTEIENGIMLCRACHTEVHSGRFVIEPAPPGSDHPWIVRRTMTLPPRRYADDDRHRLGTRARAA